MPPSHLTIDDTPVEVSLCEWHLRKVFKDEKFAERIESGEFVVARRKRSQRRNPPANAIDVNDVPYNEETVFAEAGTNREVVRCHRHLKSDGTPAASKKYDPKEINWKGVNYHQTGKLKPQCEHCAA